MFSTGFEVVSFSLAAFLFVQKNVGPTCGWTFIFARAAPNDAVDLAPGGFTPYHVARAARLNLGGGNIGGEGGVVADK